MRLFDWFARSHGPAKLIEHSNPYYSAPQILTEAKSTFFDYFRTRSPSKSSCDIVNAGQLMGLEEPGCEAVSAQAINEASNLSNEQLMTKFAGILADVAGIEAAYTDSRESREAKTPVRLEKREWQKKVKQQMPFFRRTYKAFAGCQQESTNPGLKRLTAKYTFVTRMWLGGQMPRLRLLSHLTLYDQEHERILAYFHQVYKIMNLLPRAESALESTDGELQALLEEIEAIFDRLGKGFQSLYFRLLFCILKVAGASSFILSAAFRNSSEYPQGQRYRCTTMPWTIWPALVVLWGVCWMFYYQPMIAGDGFSYLDCLAVADDHRLDVDLPEESLEVDWEALTHIFEGSSSVDSVDQGAPVTTQTEPNLMFEFPLNLMPSEPPSLTLSPANSASPAESQPTLPSQGESLPNPPVTRKPRTSRSRHAKLDCTVCGKKFRRTDVLRRHFNEQHGRGVDLFFCPERGCKRSKDGNAFKRQEQLDRHLANCKQRKKSDAARLQAYEQSSELHHLVYGVGGYDMSQTEPASSSDGESEWANALDDIPGSNDNSQLLALKRLRDQQARQTEELAKQLEDRQIYLANLDAFIKKSEQEMGGTGGQYYGA